MNALLAGAVVVDDLGQLMAFSTCFDFEAVACCAARKKSVAAATSAKGGELVLLPQEGLLDQARTRLPRLARQRIVRVEVLVATEQLRWRRDDAARILGPSDLEVAAGELDLLEDEALGGLVGGAEVDEGVVAVA